MIVVIIRAPVAIARPALTLPPAGEVLCVKQMVVDSQLGRSTSLGVMKGNSSTVNKLVFYEMMTTVRPLGAPCE